MLIHQLSKDVIGLPAVFNNNLLINYFYVDETFGKNKAVYINLPHAYTTWFCCYKTIGVATDTSQGAYRTYGCRWETLSQVYAFCIDNAKVFFLTIGY